MCQGHYLSLFGTVWSSEAGGRGDISLDLDLRRGFVDFGALKRSLLPTLHPVALREFGEQLVRGRAVRSSFPNEVVLLDDVLRGAGPVDFEQERIQENSDQNPSEIALLHLPNSFQLCSIMLPSFRSSLPEEFLLMLNLLRCVWC